MENTNNPLNISEETRNEYACIASYIQGFEGFVHYRTTMMLGSFLDAVLRNDLMDAMNRADRWSDKNLDIICKFLRNHGGEVYKVYNEVK